MSPHAVPQDDAREIRQRQLRENFSVTKNAFLPEFAPAEVLSDAYYEPWEIIARTLPQLIAADGVRSVVAQLPVLSADRLVSEAEWRRAYVILGYLTHAHVWGGQQSEEILPPQITVPFLQVSAHLELPPVLTYAAANLWNFSSSNVDSDFTDLTSLKTLVSFTGTESESWFLLISVAMEARGADIIDAMLVALEAVQTRDYETIISSLTQLAACINQVGDLLDRMYERCDPQVFYHRIRPFLAGSKNMAAAGLPRGVFYDEGDGKGEWQHLRGGSNGQSSLIQFFDIVLGVDHRGNGNNPCDKPASTITPSLCHKAEAEGGAVKKVGEEKKEEEQSFHDQVREYMPGPHSRFLLHVSRMGSIRQLALLPPQTDEQRRLRTAYTAATDALTEFRNKHIRIVTRYIVLPSRQQHQKQSSDPAAPGSRQNLANSSSREGKETELKGTGGTALMPFLKQSRDETKRAGVLL